MKNYDKPTTACVLCAKGTDSGGYGQVHIAGKRYLAHRVAYCQANGIDFEQIKGKVVRHLCDTRRCVNPEHLALGTHKENMADMVRRRRNAKLLGESHHSAKLTAAEVLEIRSTYQPWSREFSTTALARKYGVGSARIHKIVTGQSWKHLLPEHSSPANDNGVTPDALMEEAMSICVTESSESRRLLDNMHRREDALEQAEAELAHEFIQAILAGDPDATPDWTGTTPDYAAGRKLGMDYGAPGFPHRRCAVEECLMESLDYSNGPTHGDVLKVLSLAMKGTDPVVALAARQLVERAAAKYASHNVDEVDE